MDEQMIERAVEAAARVRYEALADPRLGATSWAEEDLEITKDEYRSEVRREVIAALAEVEAAIQAKGAARRG